ncbi:hypothetical protein AWC20_13780 [Mycobacterium parmense]|nr:hypothetical protein AWC20_13780 [Mycobacterium parmense]
MPGRRGGAASSGGLGGHVGGLLGHVGGLVGGLLDVLVDGLDDVPLDGLLDGLLDVECALTALSVRSRRRHADDRRPSCTADAPTAHSTP